LGTPSGLDRWVLLLTIALLPSVFQVHWAARWAPDVTSGATATTAKGQSWLPWVLLVALLALAIAGTAFVGVVAWIGCRNFNWRTGLLATALATTGALFVQQSRFIGESGITSLLWAVAALTTVAPFLVHLESHPDEVTTRYNETSVLAAQNQSRLSHLIPPVSTPELLALQLERTLGMFDRYEEWGSLCQRQRGGRDANGSH
jgi:hypothetical protein